MEEILVFDITGKPLTGEIKPHSIETSIDVSRLKKGTYILVIRTGKEIFYKKIIKN